MCYQRKTDRTYAYDYIASSSGDDFSLRASASALAEVLYLSPVTIRNWADDGKEHSLFYDGKMRSFMMSRTPAKARYTVTDLETNETYSGDSFYCAEQMGITQAGFLGKVRNHELNSPRSRYRITRNKGVHRETAA